MEQEALNVNSWMGKEKERGKRILGASIGMRNTSKSQAQSQVGQRVRAMGKVMGK